MAEREGSTCQVYPAPPAPKRDFQLPFFLEQMAALDQHTNSSNTCSVCLIFFFFWWAKGKRTHTQKCLNNKKECFLLCFPNKQKTSFPLPAKFFHFHWISAPQPTRPTNRDLKFCMVLTALENPSKCWHPGKTWKNQFCSKFLALQPGAGQRGRKRVGCLRIFVYFL